jgi:hypothetical protein
MPLSRLKPPAKSCVQPTVADRWPSPRIAAVLLFPGCGPASCLSYRPLNQLSSRFILPWRSSSSEFLRSNLPLIVSRREQTYPGSLPSSRHHRSASTFSRRLPSPRFVPSSGFLNLSTVFSALRLHRLIPSRRHVQGCRRSGASLPAQQSSLIESPCPLAVVFSSAHLRWPHGCAFALRRDRRLPRS